MESDGLLLGGPTVDTTWTVSLETALGGCREITNGVAFGTVAPLLGKGPPAIQSRSSEAISASPAPVPMLRSPRGRLSISVVSMGMVAPSAGGVAKAGLAG
jgi:hypothetical protein